MRYRLPRAYTHLESSRRAIVRDVLGRLAAIRGDTGVIWGGSTTIRPLQQRLIDVDLWFITNHVRSVKTELYQSFHDLKALTFVHQAGLYDWFGDLLSLFFFDDMSFAVDVGVCSPRRLSHLNPGPRPFVVWGNERKLLAKLKTQYYLVSPEQRVWRIIVNLLKCRRSLSRGYLWDAIEYLQRARREVIGLADLRAQGEVIYYSRPEHGVEDRMDDSLRILLARTCPSYNPSSIARCCASVAEACTKYATERVRTGEWQRPLARIRDWHTRLVQAQGQR